MKKILKNHYLYIAGVVLLTVIAWQKILNQIFMGEGYYYFLNRFSNGKVALIEILFGYSKGAVFQFEAMFFLFKDNIFFYRLTQLVLIIILNICFYLLVFALSKKKILAFIATAFFSTSFIGGFQMYGIGESYFHERVPCFIFFFLSIVLYQTFLSTREKKFYFLSIFLYFISIFISQYAVFFLPFFLAFNFANVFIQKTIKESKRVMLFYILAVLPYLFITGLVVGLDIVYGNSLVQTKEHVLMLQAPQIEIVKQMLHQLTVLTFSTEVVKESPLYKMTFFSIPSVYILTFLGYVSIFLFLLKKEKKLRIITVASFLSFFLITLENLFMRWSGIFDLITPNRYLFVPTMVLSIFWAVFFFSFFNMKKNYVLKGIMLIIIVLYLGQNIRQIYSKIDKNQYQHEAGKKVLAYIKNISPEFREDSIIIVPSVLGYYGAEYVKIFYGGKDMKFIPIFSPYIFNLSRPFDPSKDFIIAYDYDKLSVVNLTKDYKEIFAQRLEGVIDPFKKK